tara:strand:- start:2365 stop:2538 length:174 start_codon:yes stop_codon:yes gene_type:complete
MRPKPFTPMFAWVAMFVDDKSFLNSAFEPLSKGKIEIEGFLKLRNFAFISRQAVFPL